MASFNKVFLMGNLTRDPELTYTPNQMAVCKFGLAVNRKFKGRDGSEREDVLFVDCTAFDKRGEAISQYLTKGKPVFVEGSLKLDSWDDKQTGQKRSKLYVIVENFQFVGGREQGQGQDQAPQPPAKGPRLPPRQQQVPAPGPVEDAGFVSDDIPF